MGRAYKDLGELLLELDERPEALRYLRHGVRTARDPRPLVEALERAEEASEASLVPRPLPPARSSSPWISGTSDPTSSGGFLP